MDDMKQPAPAPEREVIEVTPREPKEAPKSAELPRPEPEPEAEPKPAKSIREALDGAKVKAEAKEAAKPEPKDDTAKAPKPKESAPEEDQPPEEAKPTRERAVDGKFAAREQEEQPKRQTAFREPPHRFDDDAKREWEAVPESVRGNITRMQRELEGGIQKYRQSAEEFENIREYADLARQSNTTVKQALDNYVGMERLLRQNPMQGLEAVVSNLGLKDGQGQPLTFRALAMAVAGQKPEAVQAQHDATINQLRQQVQQLTQQLGGVTQHFQRQETESRQTAAEHEWTSFMQANPRASALEGDIADILRSVSFGDNVNVRDRLDMAYAIAERRNPDAAHTGSLAQTQTPRQPNPAGQKSISGSAATGTLTPSAKPTTPPSIQDALRDAARRAGRSV